MKNDIEKRKIARHELDAYFSPESYGSGISTLDNIRHTVDRLTIPDSILNEERAAKIVDYLSAENELSYGLLQEPVLEKIYGPEVQEWDAGKKHTTYVKLLGAELADMIRENRPAEIHKTLNAIIHKERPASDAEGLLIENNYRRFAIRVYDGVSRNCILEGDDGEIVVARNVPNQAGKLIWDKFQSFGKGPDALDRAKADSAFQKNTHDMKME